MVDDDWFLSNEWCQRRSVAWLRKHRLKKARVRTLTTKKPHKNQRNGYPQPRFKPILPANLQSWLERNEENPKQRQNRKAEVSELAPIPVEFPPWNFRFNERKPKIIEECDSTRKTTQGVKTYRVAFRWDDWQDKWNRSARKRGKLFELGLAIGWINRNGPTARTAIWWHMDEGSSCVQISK